MRCPCRNSFRLVYLYYKLIEYVCQQIFTRNHIFVYIN